MISLIRPVMVICPLALMLAVSPVLSQPSLSIMAAVASGLFQYPSILHGPLTSSAFCSPMRTSMSGSGCPTVEGRLFPTRLMLTTGLVSVMP